MYGMVGSSGGGGGGNGSSSMGEARSSSTRSRRSLRDQQAKRSLRNFRQQSTMSLHERGSLRLRSGDSVGSSSGLSQGGPSVPGSANFKTIREGVLQRGSTIDVANISLDDSGNGGSGIVAGVVRTKDTNCTSGGGNSTGQAEKNKLARLGSTIGIGKPFAGSLVGRSASGGGGTKPNDVKRRGDPITSLEDLERCTIPSPTHDIYCCSNVSASNADGKSKTTGDIGNCCGVRYYHKDVNCEAYSAPSSPNHNHHYHHYQHSHRHLISICRRLLRIIKQAWTGVKFGSDLELDEIEQERRYRPEALSSLCRSTHFSKDQVQRLYRSFKEFCPTGVVTEDAFKEMYSQIFPKGASSSQYASFVFSTLDTEQEGVVSFEALITLLSKLTHGSQLDRLHWVFSLYDLDADGCITRQEMAEVVRAVYDLLGKGAGEGAAAAADEEAVAARVEDLFKVLDTNQDGVITAEEFVEACTRDANILQNLDTLAASLRPH